VRLEQLAEIAVGLDQVGVALHRSTESVERLGLVAAEAEGIAQVVVGHRKVGLLPDGLVELGDGIVGFPQVKPRHIQVVGRLGEVGREPQRAPAALDCRSCCPSAR
jgi:hypothetical protein